MRIGILKETKTLESRVALVPSQVGQMTRRGHGLLVQRNAGKLSGYTDHDYRRAGAKIVSNAADLIRETELIIKVKEPTMQEVGWMRPDQSIFCFLHLAAFPQLTQKILQKKISAIGYETVELSDGSLPCLKPMSEIAGKMATQNGAHLLRADQGGRGVLLGGTATVAPARVLVLGGGTVGSCAAEIAVGMGAAVDLVDRLPERLSQLAQKFGKKIHLHRARPRLISALARKADLIIGAVLITGKQAPKLVTMADVRAMRKGSVIVDVSVDQGGCIETSQVTSHLRPIVKRYGVLHYGVPNIPGCVPVTSTLALSEATFPYIQKMADLGVEMALKQIPALGRAVNCHAGRIIHPGLKKVF